MGYAQPWSGSVGFGKQASALATLAAATQWQAITSESMKMPHAGRKFEKAIRRGQDPTLAMKGILSTSGNISGPLIPDDFFQGRLWACLLGNQNSVSTVDTSAYLHTFLEPRVGTPADWPAYGETIEINRGSYDNTLLFQFIGSFVKSVTITVPKDGAVTVDTEWVGCKQATAGTYATPTFSSKNPFEGWMADLKVGANYAGLASIDFETVKIKISNGVSMRQGLNGRYPNGRSFGEHLESEIEFTYSLQESLTQFAKIFADTENALSLTLTSDQLAGAASAYYSLQFIFPRVIFPGDEPGLSVGETIPHTMKAVAGYGSDGSASYMVKVLSQNTQSGTYAA